MPTPFFIVGPTAVGKTGLAVAVAERCGAEIVSADAFQVYAGLDLLTAKPAPKERERVPHHLVGTVPLGEIYSVARYQREATRILEGIAGRRRPGLVVGGSGMYIKALTHGLSPLPPAQPVLRAELEALDVAALLRRLDALDPATARSIDGANKRRLIRAIEVCEVTGRRFSDFREQWNAPDPPPGPCGVFLVRSKEELDGRIRRRVEAMFSHGAIEEVRSQDPTIVAETGARMIGLKQIRAYLAGGISLPDCVDKVVIASRQYAKRQITWFKREKVFEILHLAGDEHDDKNIETICERIMRQGIGCI